MQLGVSDPLIRWRDFSRSVAAKTIKVVTSD